VKNAFRSGERIYFRPLEVEDLEACQGWLNDPENLQFLARFKPLGRSEERQWLETLHEKEGQMVFGIVLKEGDRLIGNCGLHGAALPHRTAELGIAIGDRRFQGQGFGAEALRLLLDFGFGTLGLHRISLYVYANNARGIRCYEKVGFRREGTRREARWWNGRWWDILEYAILEHEWQALSPRNTAK
jgi:RimJ/RimL family protein N-acetyltransferase